MEEGIIAICKIYCVAILITFVISAIIGAKSNSKAPPDVELKLNDSDTNTMLVACEYYRVKYPRIATSQAILELRYIDKVKAIEKTLPP